MFDQLLISAIFISLLAGQFARIELFKGEVNIYVQEILLLIFIVSSFIRYGITPLRVLFKSKVTLAFSILLLFSFFISFDQFSIIQNGVALLYFVRLVLYLVFGIYLFTSVKKEKNKRIYIYNQIFTFSILLLTTTTIQYIFYPNFWILKPLGWDPHMFRASAAYFDIYIAAAVYGMLAFYWLKKKNYILVFLFTGALALSFSRSAYIAFILSLAYFFISQRKWKEILLTILMFIILIMFIPKPFGEGVNLFRTASIQSRILDYKLGFKIWQEKPLFGFGYNRIRAAREHLNLVGVDDRSHSLSAFHSSLLIILVTTGLAGFCVFLFQVVLFFRKYPRLRLYVIYILTMSLFDNVLLHVLVLLPLIFIMSSLNYSSLE